MANTFRQPTQSDLEREQFRLGLASVQSKAYTQSQANPSQSATEIDYTTAPDRISLNDLNKLNQSAAQSAPKSDTPVLDFWKRQQAAKSAAGTDYTSAPDRISLNDLRQKDKSAAQNYFQSDAPVMEYFQRQQAAKSAQGSFGSGGYGAGRSTFQGGFGSGRSTSRSDLDPGFSIGWPVSQGDVGNGYGGGRTTSQGTFGDGYGAGRDTSRGGFTGGFGAARTASEQSAPWLNTPQYGDDGTVLSQDSSAQGQNALPYDFGDDGTVLSQDKLAQNGSRGYDESIWEDNPVRKAMRQVVLGRYAGETTPLGTTLQILASLTGADTAADVRDLYYDLTHWENTTEHKWQVALDLVALLPVIGALKNADKAGELAQSVFKYGDEFSDVLKALPSGADEAAGLIGGLAKNSDEVGELAQGVIRYGDEAEGAAGDILPKVTKALRKIAADEPWLPANWKEQLEEGWAAGGYEEETVTKGAGETGIKPYSTSRPKYGRTQVDDVWNTHANLETGTVTDPSGATIVWDRTKPRNGQWDMGHIPGQKYSDTHARYMNGELSLDEFLKWYRNPQNYRPELPGTNRSHLYEDNWPYLK